MKKIISKAIYKISGLNFKCYSVFRSLAEKIYQSPKSISELNKIKWYKDEGDSSLRVQYALNENSVVLDVGGYEGDWAAEISARYACSIFIFEPVSIYISRLKNRFAANRKIHVLPYGLAATDQKVRFHIMDQSSGAFKEKEKYSIKTEGVEEVSLKGYENACRESGINNVDLIKINIEGGEYELLEHIIKSGLIAQITDLQIQFHDFVENADQRMNSIKKELEKTHRLTYEYVYVWENWTKK